MYVSKDSRSGAIFYTPPRIGPDGRLEVLGFAVARPMPPLPTPLLPTPFPEPTAAPTPPAPTPAPCSASWQASLTASVSVISESQAEVTFLADWISPPATGWISDSSWSVQQASIGPKVPVVFTYERWPEAYSQWLL